MLTRIRDIFAPPVFPEDEDKTRQAKVLNILLMSSMTLLILECLVAIPLLFEEKLINFLATLALLGSMGMEYWLMRRGRVQLASTMFSYGIWSFFTLYLLLSGGIHSILIIYYVVCIVVTGLLLGMRGTLIQAIASSFAGLGMVILELSGHPFPRIFVLPPIVGWLDMTIALLMTSTVVIVVIRSLNGTLSLTRQRLEELKRAEETIRKSEEKFRILFETSRDFLYITGMDGRIIDANKAAFAMSGYSIDELKNIKINELYCDENERDILIGKTLEQGFVENYEIKGKKKDGTIIDALVNSTVVKDKNGNIVGFQGSIKDISERKRAEENITRQVERLLALNAIEKAITSTMDLNTILELLVREIVERLHIDAASVLILNSQTQTLDFAAKQGFQTEALKYTHLGLGAGLAGRAAREHKILHIANLSEMDNNPILVQSIAAEGFVTYFGVPLVAKDQLCGVLEIFHRSTLASDPDWLSFLETLAGQAAISIDNARLLETTQRDLIEINALYHISQRLAASLDPNRLMKDVVDLLAQSFGYYHVAILLIDPAQGDLVLRQGSGEIGAQLKAQGARLPRGAGIIGYVVETGEPFVANNVDEVVFFLRHPLLANTQSEMVIPIKVEDKVVGVLDIQQEPPNSLLPRDLQLMNSVADQLAVSLQKANLYAELQTALTQEKTTRSQLLQIERLSVAGRLLASVSHELNNPLQAIQNALFLIQNEQGLSQQGKQDLEIILSETDRMASMLERLRMTYRPVTVEEFRSVQINSLIGDVYALVATHLRHNHIAFEFHADPSLPPIPGLADQLRQVLLNLFMNAVDAMADGGVLNVSTHFLVDRNETLITVTDSGPGIEPAILPNVFDAFVTNKESGTGLGLTISYEIISKHHGRIQAQNNPECGATFKVWLPVE